MGRRKERVSQAPRGEAGQGKVRKVTAQRWRWLSSSFLIFTAAGLPIGKESHRGQNSRSQESTRPQGNSLVKTAPPAQLGTASEKSQVENGSAGTAGLKKMVLPAVE